jgi:uncharacterized phage protein (TIGR01671 family)
MLPKLRVWLKEEHFAGIRDNKRYSIPKGIYTYAAIFSDNPHLQNLRGAVLLYVENDEATDKYFEVLVKPKDVEIMQCTGITDENGNEIWEGDIVEVNCCNYDEIERCYVTDFEITGIVTYNSDRAVFCIGNISIPVLLDYESRTFFKVIGNKYENPELLKEE